MKKLSLFFALSLFLLPLSSAFPRTISAGVLPYVAQQKGDTLVIKDYFAANDSANTLYSAIFADTVNLPKDRVYELLAGGWYPETNTITTTSTQPTIIMGPDNTPLVQQTGTPPPEISGYTPTGGTTQTPGITAGDNLTVKNCAMTPSAPDQTLNWSYFGFGPNNTSITLDNDLMEHTRWTFINGGTNCSLYCMNDYFVNMNGQPCRRNGGVYDSFAPGDTMWVENCTHVMAQGTVWKLRDNVWQRVVFNHNTFINMAGSVFMSLGYESNMSVTNNLFINCNIQPYPGIHSIDPGEQDLGWEPMGLVNVYPDSADVANGTARKFLVQDNDAYWDPSLANIVHMEDSAATDGVTNWQSQMILWNTRTDSIFHHLGPYNTTPYKYCNSDTWLNVMPTFANSQDLFTTQLANAKEFAYETVDTGSIGSAAILADFRVTSSDSTAYIYPDWPIPVNLSYTNANLIHAGLGGFAIGDLNWFPTQKAAWLAQRATEYSDIAAAMNNGVLAVNGPVSSVPDKFQLDQNYPNPFNPSTEISFAIPKSGYVSLKVYNILGQEVATLMDGFKTAQNYKIEFNGSNLASGVYFYTLRFGNQSISKKMLLLK